MKNTEQNTNNKIEGLLFHPHTINICNNIICSVCTEQNKLVNGFNLTKSCNIRKKLIKNKFLTDLG